jgi:apolipoprotein N-acyltransferase
VLGVQFGGYAAVSLRTTQLEHRFGGCRKVPLEERPPSLVPITCEADPIDIDGVFLAVLWLFVVFVALLTWAIPVVIGALALRARAQSLWIPGGLAIGLAVFCATRAMHTLGYDRGLASLGATLGAVSAACLFSEWRRPAVPTAA